MNKLSTGADSTLGNYRKLASMFFEEGSAPMTFLDRKISESPKGDAEEVIADETQMIQLLMTMSMGDASSRALHRQAANFTMRKEK